MGNGSSGGGDDDITGKHTLLEDEPIGAVSNRDLFRMISRVSRHVDRVASNQKGHREEIEDLKRLDKDRTAGFWKLIITLICVFTPAFVGAIWQGGRLIERIDQMADQVHRIGDDHEVRIRAVEHR